MRLDEQPYVLPNKLYDTINVLKTSGTNFSSNNLNQEEKTTEEVN